MGLVIGLILPPAPFKVFGANMFPVDHRSYRLLPMEAVGRLAGPRESRRGDKTRRRTDRRSLQRARTARVQTSQVMQCDVQAYIQGTVLQVSYSSFDAEVYR